MYKLLVHLFPIDYHQSDKSIGKQSRVTSENLKKTLDSRPIIRTRKTGPVGPELDWSVIYSDVPVDVVRSAANRGARSHGRYDIFPFLDSTDPYYQKSTNSTLAKHRCIPTFAMTAHNVELWTRFAMENGIHYLGSRGYTRVKSGLGTFDGAEFFRQLKKAGLTTRHTRSEPSRIIRAAKRGKRDASVYSRDSHSLFTTRYRLSAKRVRQDFGIYRSHGGSLDFQSYRSNFVGKGVTLFPHRCRDVVPNIVFKSLKRIYSRPTKVVRDKLWFKPDADLKYTLETYMPPAKKAYTVLKPGSVVHIHRTDDGVKSSLYSTIPRFSQRLASELNLEASSKPVSSSLYHSKIEEELDPDYLEFVRELAEE